MAAALTRLELGQRIAQLRKQKGLSQEALAQHLGMSRSSLTQIELGNRGIDVQELQQLSELLGVSLYALLGTETVQPIDFGSISPMQTDEMRVSVPHLQLEKFIHVLLYILGRCAGKPNVGETVLNKLLYFADFNYYELYEEQMTGATYRKLPFGPVPQEVNAILEQMVQNNQLQRIKTSFHGFPQTRYIPLQKPNLQLLRASEKEVIDHVIDQMGDWNAAMISEWSHKDMPWRATKDGDDIEYELAFYREMPFSVRIYEDDEEV